jgi:hypothetical protein
MELGCGGVSSQELATGDFPSAEGLRPIQAIKGPAAAARHRLHQARLLHRDPGVFSVFLPLFWVFL